ncbi:PREDICTED: rust resistance kinase Lr10 isoform X1 [Theobroma cacao]|uniref:Rust resistance kinase Lr10 isoform X1 n=1 Tax=Theobroma cacao TaxID=3641 RepID=A0AB32VT76_THECC|nr:PREDICTED: rust resistance kinase Lr10 isoform X1 [Theobroma cacao]
MTIQNVIDFQLIIFLLYLCHGEAGKSCPYAACSEEGPSVRFPFWLKDRQPESCGYPGFALSCSKRNETLIEIPYSGQFVVADIDYEYQNIYISDPKGCMARRLMTLNVTSSPFMISGALHFILLNCSSITGRPELLPLDCLSSSNHLVYAVNASTYMSLDLLSSCHFTADVTSSLNFSHKAFMPSFYDLTLGWEIAGCDIGCRVRGGECRLKGNNSLEVECSIEHLPAYKSSPSEAWNMIIRVSIGILIIPLPVTLTILYLIRSRRSQADVQKMTNEFRKKLGQGGYGSVFKGELENGVPVAVKLLDNSKGNGEDFTNEISIIGRIHHVNVVRLFGYSADESEQALVYEFMPNKSLDKFIFPANSNRPELSWGKLQQIAIGVAKGIEYLHQGCNQRILHFDIKPQNILLDIDFNPKISDFGLAKLFPKKESVVSITAVRGTTGYIAPEVYFSGNIGNVSYKTDVYSYGMLLFEMVGSKRNKDLTVGNTSQVYFPQWVYNRLANGEDLGIKEEKEGDADIAKKLSVVAIWCVQWDPSNRPSMSTVIQMLEGRTRSLPLPPDPFASLSLEESDLNVL